MVNYAGFNHDQHVRGFGIVVWNQVSGGDPMHEEGRKPYTEGINAAVS